MGISERIREKLEIGGVYIAKDLKSRLRNISDTGKQSDSIDSNVTKSGSIQISGLFYTYFTNYGRGVTKTKTAGAKTLYEIMQEYGRRKGIPEKRIKTFAYFAAKKIHEKGIQVPNWRNPGKQVEASINANIQNILNDVAGDLSREIITEIFPDEWQQ